MLNTLHKRAGDEKGFTLIELLVVSSDHRHPRRDRPPRLPRSARSRAGHRGRRPGLRQGQTAMETFYTDNQTYDRLEGAAGRHRAVPRRRSGNSFNRHEPDRQLCYTLSVQSKTGNTFSIVKASDGSVARSCSHRRHHQGRLPGQQQLVSTAPHRPLRSILDRSWWTTMW